MAEPNNTPIMGMTPRSTSPAPKDPQGKRNKPIVLHIGDPVCYNLDTYAIFSEAFEVVRPELADRQRPAFMQALRERRWGDFSAIFRPFWGTGGEMGKWDAELIGLLPESCRVFASAGAGFDWADTKALGERGIIYCNSGVKAAEAVADFAVAMVISTFRHLPWCMDAATAAATRDASDSKAAFDYCHKFATAASHNLRDHKLGLVGLGNIGQQLARKLGSPAFGMEVHYFDLQRKPARLEKSLGAIFHSELKSLLQESDCLVICVPPATNGKPILDRDALAKLKPAARIVNVARGGLVDEDALADALESGAVSAAALDVHSQEPRVHERLLKLAIASSASFPTSSNGNGIVQAPAATPGRVMLTCHNAGGTVETHIGFEELSMRNIMAVLGGRKPLTPVNLKYLKTDTQSHLAWARSHVPRFFFNLFEKISQAIDTFTCHVKSVVL